LRRQFCFFPMAQTAPHTHMIFNKYVIIYMKLFRTPQVELNKMWFYVFLKNSEIRNNSRLLGEPSRLPQHYPGSCEFIITLLKKNIVVVIIIIIVVIFVVF
jgi:hypothetical protein